MVVPGLMLPCRVVCVVLNKATATELPKPSVSSLALCSVVQGLADRQWVRMAVLRFGLQDSRTCRCRLGRAPGHRIGGATAGRGAGRLRFTEHGQIYRALQTVSVKTNKPYLAHRASEHREPQTDNRGPKCGEVQEESARGTTGTCSIEIIMMK